MRTWPQHGCRALLLCLLAQHFAAATRFMIVSLISGAVPKPYYAQAVVNRLLYATRHNYAIRLYPQLDERRAASWSKILALKSAIRMGASDWILWLDLDAIITNFDTRISELVPQDEAIDLVLAEDCNGLQFGVFLMRASLSSIELLDELYSGEHVTDEVINHEW